MATKNDTGREGHGTVSRRGFLAVGGALAAAAALPATALAAGVSATHEVWSDAASGWRAAIEALVEQFRPRYLDELQRFAETLRPRFEAGELRGFTEEDGERELHDREWRAPRWQLDDLCVEHFGLEVDDDNQGDDEAAHLVLACSPSTDATCDRGWTAPQHHATSAVARDVIIIARARGWYTPALGEEPEIEEPAEAQEARS